MDLKRVSERVEINQSDETVITKTETISFTGVSHRSFARVNQNKTDSTVINSIKKVT